MRANLSLLHHLVRGCSVAQLLLCLSLGTCLCGAAASNVDKRLHEELWLAPSGNDNNPGTREAPLLSFARADALARPGATIHVQPGRYYGYTAQHTLQITRSGTDAERIRWVSEQKWGAKLIGHVNPSNQLGWGVLVAGNFVDLVDFDVTSDANMGIWVVGTHVRVIGNHVHNIPGQRGCTSFGASGIEQGNYRGGYMEVIGNVVHDVGSGGPGSCNKYQGIYLAAPYDRAVNNISFRNASKGITTWHAATHNTISNNTVFGNDVGILVGAGDMPCFRACMADHVVVTNNILYRNKSIGFWQYARVGSHNRYSNNLTFANGLADVLLEGICNAGVRPCNAFLHGIRLDPQFVNASGSIFEGDYHLKATSPARRAGVSLGAPPIDFDGRERSSTELPDLGAYQVADQAVSSKRSSGSF